MASNNQNYGGFTPGQQWQQNMENQNAQSWEPGNQDFTSNNAPAYYTSATNNPGPQQATNNTSGAPGSQQGQGWQQQAGWHKPEANFSPIQLLNRKGLPGISWESKTHTYPSGTVVYISIIHYLGAQYTGVGRAQNDAMNDAAKYLLKSLGDPVPFYKEENPATSAAIADLHQLLQAKKINPKLNFIYTLQGPPFECSVSFNNITYTALGANKKVAKAAVAARILDSINSGQAMLPESSDEASSVPAETATALGELTAKLAGTASLEWNLSFVKSNATNAVMHIAQVTIAGRQFAGQEISKKRAKNAAAIQVLQAIENNELILPTKSLKRPAEAMTDVQAESSGEPAAKKKTTDDMNPLAKLNHLFSGAVTWSFSGSGPSHEPMFVATATVQDQAYSGTAGSKKEAKMAACLQVLMAVESGQLVPPKRPEPRPRKEKSAEKMDASATEETAADSVPTIHNENAISSVNRLLGGLTWEYQQGGSPHEPVFVIRTKIGDKGFTGSASNKKEAKLHCCQSILEAIEAGAIKPVKGANTPLPTVTGAVGKLWPDLHWDYTIEGRVHEPTFTVTCEIDGITFEATGGSKKAAKHEACIKIMEALEAGTLTRPTPNPPFTHHTIKKFNSMFGSPQINVERAGTEENPEFKASTVIEDRVWTGTGPSIEAATASLIGSINAAWAAKEIELPVMVRFERKFKERKIDVQMTGTDDKPGYTATFTLGDQTFTASSTEGEHLAMRDVALQALKSSFATPKKVTEDKDNAAIQKTPLQLLHEKTTGNPVKIEVELVGDPKGVIPFVAKATIDGQTFQGSGQSKMSAKHSCAAVILAEVYGHKFETVGTFNAPQSEHDIQRGDIGGVDPQALSTHVQNLVRLKYADAVSSLDSRFQGRKVLSGCVMVRGDNLQDAKVIAVATGTKCINGENMSHNGRVINDMHAEILVRRAMKKYLYNELHLAQSSQPSIFIPTEEDGGRHRLADDVRFHLYISSPPCGDSRIFIASTTKEGEDAAEQSRDNNPARANRGQLRVKIEAGMGTIPVKSCTYEKAQSWEAIMSGERYLNMSCCDKVARWALLGLQGSLLCNFIRPVYFSSVIVGSMFNQEHIYRGLYGRVKELDSLGKVTAPFRHHCPEIIGTIAPELRNTNKSPWHSVIWQAVDGSIEVLDTRNGRTMEKKRSSLCKAVLFKEYRALKTEKTIPDSYTAAKATAEQYQDLKNSLHMALQAKGLGQWVGKPAEQDMFVDEPDEVIAPVTPTTTAVSSIPRTEATTTPIAIPAATAPATAAATPAKAATTPATAAATPATAATTPATAAATPATAATTPATAAATPATAAATPAKAATTPAKAATAPATAAATPATAAATPATTPAKAVTTPAKAVTTPATEAATTATAATTAAVTSTAGASQVVIPGLDLPVVNEDPSPTTPSPKRSSRRTRGKPRMQ